MSFVCSSASPSYLPRYLPCLITTMAAVRDRSVSCPVVASSASIPGAGGEALAQRPPPAPGPPSAAAHRACVTVAPPDFASRRSPPRLTIAAAETISFRRGYGSGDGSSFQESSDRSSPHAEWPSIMRVRRIRRAVAAAFSGPRTDVRGGHSRPPLVLRYPPAAPHARPLVRCGDRLPRRDDGRGRRCR